MPLFCIKRKYFYGPGGRPDPRGISAGVCLVVSGYRQLAGRGQIPVPFRGPESTGEVSHPYRRYSVKQDKCCLENRLWGGEQVYSKGGRSTYSICKRGRPGGTGGTVQDCADLAYIRTSFALPNSGKVSMNLAYRWFIGFPLNEVRPHFSTASYNFRHRFN